MANWCTIESDPGVFTELMQQIGVKNVQVEEFYDIDQASFDKAKPIYGLIFLFKWQKDEKDTRSPDPKADTVYFAKQVINNACATQAIINVLLNCTGQVDIGPELTKFKNFTDPLPADIRGMAMQNSAVLRTVHNSFARPDPFEAFGEKPKKDDDDDDEAFHFIGYVPINDSVYELDGLKPGPIKIGDCKTGTDWLTVAHSALKERISRYAAKEVRFNVMGLVKNRKAVLEAELTALESKKASAAAGDAKSIDTQIADIKESIASENAKFAAWKAENVRRRHNYVPFAFGLLKALADKGKLKGLVDAAAKSAEDRKKKKEEEKKKSAAAAKPAASATK